MLPYRIVPFLILSLSLFCKKLSSVLVDVSQFWFVFSLLHKLQHTHTHTLFLVWMFYFCFIFPISLLSTKYCLHCLQLGCIQKRNETNKCVGDNNLVALDCVDCDRLSVLPPKCPPFPSLDPVLLLCMLGLYWIDCWLNWFQWIEIPNLLCS